MVYALALLCALLNALISIFQRMGVEDAPDSATLRLSLMKHVIKRGIWLLGFVLMIGSFVSQSFALHFGRLSQVQPILTSELVFLVLILATWFRFRISATEWVGCLAAAGGLAGFLYFAMPGGGNHIPVGWDWVESGSICGGLALAGVLLALRGPRWWRATMFGISGAVGFAFTASLQKTVSDFAASDWTHLFVHWQSYAMAGAGLLSVFLAQNAFHAGPIAASQTALVLADPLTSVALGIALYHDRLRTAGAYGPLEAISLAVMFIGAAFIAHSPLVSSMRGDDEKYAEMLSLRSRSRRLAGAVQGVLPPEVVEHLPPEVSGLLPGEPKK